LYGLRQAPRPWFNRFVSFIITVGFIQFHADSSLFVLRRGGVTTYLLLYVNDIIMSASSTTLLQEIIDWLKSEFAIKDRALFTSSSASTFSGTRTVFSCPGPRTLATFWNARA
jgi:hypothetical protein